MRWAAAFIYCNYPSFSVTVISEILVTSLHIFNKFKCFILTIKIVHANFHTMQFLLMFRVSTVVYV